MNEITNIHLDRQQFSISVEAHKDLRKYLDAIKKQPGVHAEVIKEIEMRMAELLTEHGVTQEKVVLTEDVVFLKQQLGEPRDFKDEAAINGQVNDDKFIGIADGQAEDGQKNDRVSQPKRLYRDIDNGIVAGVASGLAAYTGIDVILIRITLVALTFASGAGILLYILLWVLTPEAKTPSDRLQMHGKAVTVDSLKEMISQADIAGASHRATEKVRPVAGRMLSKLFKVTSFMVGSLFIGAGAAAMLWTIATGSYILIHGGQIGSSVVFPLGSRETLLTIIAFATIGLLGFFLLMVGLSTVSRRWRLPGWGVATLATLFVILSGLGVALGFDTYPNVRNRFQAASHSEARQLAAFTSVNLTGQDTTYSFIPDTRYYMEIRYLGYTDTKLLSSTVANGTLTIDSQQFAKTSLCSGLCFYNDHQLQVVIHAPFLDTIKLAGTDNRFAVDDPLTQDNMTLIVSRNHGNDISLEHITVGTAELIDNKQSDRTLMLGAVKHNVATNERVAMYGDDDAMYVDATDKLTLTTNRQCDQDEPLIYLSQEPQQININGRLVKKDSALEHGRSVDGSIIYDCVRIH